MSSHQIAVYRAGGVGREVAWLEQSTAIGGKGGEVGCFIDDDQTPAEFGADSEQGRLALEDENIEGRPVWKSMHPWPRGRWLVS